MSQQQPTGGLTGVPCRQAVGASIVVFVLVLVIAGLVLEQWAVVAGAAVGAAVYPAVACLRQRLGS